MIRTTDYPISEFGHSKALASQMRRAMGLDQSTAAALREISALNAYGALEKLRQQTESLLGTPDYMLREAKKIAGAIADAEQIRKRHAPLFSDVFSDMDRYRRMVNDAIGPLSAWRSAALYESEAARMASQSDGLLGAARMRSCADAFSATEQMRKQQELLATSFGERLAGRWLSSARDIAKHFPSARDVIEKQAKSWRDATASDPAQLVRGLGVPLMDPASFAAITRSSGVDGILAQLRSFGIDDATLRAVASTVAKDADEAEELLRDSAGPTERPRRQLTKAQLVRLWNIVFILYSVLFPIYTWWDSNQAEARITGEIKAAEGRTSADINASEQRVDEKLDVMAKLMERVLEIGEQEVLIEESMVVRGRVAAIRADPRHGASVVAEAFPNQVVTVLEERGKWIKVEYYDWLARDERTGWALKKYFVRAERSPAPRPRRGRVQSLTK